MEAHADFVCDQVTGGDSGAPRPISDDFTWALRGEAADDDLAVPAALPLVTLAAHPGGLELLYPNAAKTGQTAKDGAA